MKRTWTPEQTAMLIRDYPTVPTRILAERLNRRPQTVQKRAYDMGIKKIKRDIWTARGVPKGWGLWGFKFTKGQAPKNAARVGAMTKKSGRTYIKVANTPLAGGKNWKPYQQYVWEQANGPIPDGYLVMFKDGNKENFALANLELATKRDRIRRNSIHNLPPELVQLHQARGTLNRAINRKNRNGK